MRLFVDRATKARPNFQLTDDNAAAVAQICHRLDGIPLAIELAAARVRGLTVEQVAAGLDDRFRLLTGGARTVLPRQQTLQASVDWSYELLSDRERAVFRRLAVFAGGFTLDAAEPVGAGADIEPVEVLELLIALVDKSMIDTDDERSRYRMLESLRQYAAAGSSKPTRPPPPATRISRGPRSRSTRSTSCPTSGSTQPTPSPTRSTTSASRSSGRSSPVTPRPRRGAWRRSGVGKFPAAILAPGSRSRLGRSRCRERRTA